MTRRARKVWLLASAITVTLGITTPARATPARVAVFGEGEPGALSKLARNIAALKMEAFSGLVERCARETIEPKMSDLGVETAICANGDQIGIWTKTGDRVALRGVFVVDGIDDRAQELAAARASLALQTLSANQSFTIVTSGSGGAMVTTPDREAGPSAPATPTADTHPASAPLARPERYPPRFVLGAGPALMASEAGGAFGVSVDAAIGVGRYVALVPWFQFMPSPRTAEKRDGSASYRPTLFGTGLEVPLARNSALVVPRLGAGYGLVWMHVTPEVAHAPAITGEPEDLLAPFMYGTAAASVRVASNARIVAEGMLGVSSHNMVVRIGDVRAAEWGVPLASLALRGEWVLP